MDYYEKTVSSEMKFKGNIIKVETMTVTLPDGRTSTRDIVRHPGASVVIPLSSDNHLYVVRQYRKAIEKTTIELPAGKLDPGEDPKECAIRELK